MSYWKIWRPGSIEMWSAPTNLETTLETTTALDYMDWGFIYSLYIFLSKASVTPFVLWGCVYVGYSHGDCHHNPDLQICCTPNNLQIIIDSHNR